VIKYGCVFTYHDIWENNYIHTKEEEESAKKSLLAQFVP
jgi:hypothetical protein